MSSGFSGKGRAFSWKRLLPSFRYALAGICLVWREPNFRVHAAAAVAVILFGLYVSLARWEWVLILFMIFGMFMVELLNTAIEKIVDLVTEDYHPLAKQAKDLAAGAVLMYAILSVIIGILIFFPKLFG